METATTHAGVGAPGLPATRPGSGCVAPERVAPGDDGPANLLPGIREPRCKVCALPDELLEEVERLRLAEGCSNPAIAAWLSAELRRREPGIELSQIPSARNFSAHFRHPGRPIESRIAYHVTTCTDSACASVTRTSDEVLKIFRDRRIHELIDPLVDQLAELIEQRETLASELLAGVSTDVTVRAQYLATARELRDTIRTIQRTVDPRHVFGVLGRELFGEAVRDVLAAVWQGIADLARESGAFTRSRNLDAELLALIDRHLQALVPRVTEVASDHTDRMMSLFDRPPRAA